MGKSLVLSLGVLFEEGAGDETGDGSEEPLDAPELDGLPVERGAGGEQDPDRDRANQTKRAEQKCNEGGRGKSKTDSEGGQFCQAGYLDYAFDGLVRPAGSTTMAVARADDEFGLAFLAGLAANLTGDDRSRGGSPELVVCLIDNPCHSVFSTVLS